MTSSRHSDEIYTILFENVHIYIYTIIHLHTKKNLIKPKKLHVFTTHADQYFMTSCLLL